MRSYTVYEIYGIAVIRDKQIFRIAETNLNTFTIPEFPFRHGVRVLHLYSGIIRGATPYIT